MCEEMRWLEYGHRLHQSRRGVCTEATSESDLAKLLFQYATTNGAGSLNLKVVSNFSINYLILLISFRA